VIYKRLDDVFATVGAEEDIDGAAPSVTVCTDRRDPEAVTLEMTPKAARMLARRLNRWAKLVSSR